MPATIVVTNSTACFHLRADVHKPLVQLSNRKEPSQRGKHQSRISLDFVEDVRREWVILAHKLCKIQYVLVGKA